MSADRRTAVNLIAGPLGVGKTTAINHLLRHRPEGERWAVLVNEYGMVGIDAAMLDGGADGPEGVHIREVVGGCICCSAGLMFDVSLVLLLKQRPDRLLIEPTGLAALAGVQDTLGRPGIREAIDLRSIICLLDPGRLSRSLERPEVQDQVEAADVLLATRPDFVSTDEREAFSAWAGTLFPKKRLVAEVEQGQLPLSWLDLVRGREAQERDGHAHGTDHHHGHPEPAAPTKGIMKKVHRSERVSTVGWICGPELVFCGAGIAAWVSELKETTRRVKAVLRTDEGVLALNIIDGRVQVRTSAYRRDSRLELVIEGLPPDVDALDRALRACVCPQDAPQADA